MAGDNWTVMNSCEWLVTEQWTVMKNYSATTICTLQIFGNCNRIVQDFWKKPRAYPFFTIFEKKAISLSIFYWKIRAGNRWKNGNWFLAVLVSEPKSRNQFSAVLVPESKSRNRFSTVLEPRNGNWFFEVLVPESKSRNRFSAVLVPEPESGKREWELILGGSCFRIQKQEPVFGGSGPRIKR